MRFIGCIFCGKVILTQNQINSVIRDRSEARKEYKRILKRTPEYKEKRRLYAKEYRKRDYVKSKIEARKVVDKAIADGRITRPNHCELCGEKEYFLHDFRSSLRADHYKGYAYKNHLVIRFICVTCDGKQMRKYTKKDLELVK